MFSSHHKKRLSIAALAGAVLMLPHQANAQPLPGGTLDPLTIPKYVTPLVIPPVMNNDGEDDSYDQRPKDSACIKLSEECACKRERSARF